MAYRKSTLSQRPDGQYRRNLGKVADDAGRLKPKRFLLGKDKRQAERANVLL